MRLFWIREGIEDFEYLKILKNLNEQEFLRKQTSSFLRNI
jgi:hypothetical protein